jgi:hypothetical protein
VENDRDNDVIRRLNEVEKSLLEAIRHEGHETREDINSSTQEILAALAPPVLASTATLLYSIQGGTNMGAPISGTVGNTATPTFTEATATGVNVAPIGPVVYASDTPANVTVDPNTGVATLVAAGTANVSALDQGNGLTDSVAFTVTAAPPPVATTASLNYTLSPTRRR